MSVFDREKRQGINTVWIKLHFFVLSQIVLASVQFAFALKSCQMTVVMYVSCVLINYNIVQKFRDWEEVAVEVYNV